MDTYFDHFRWTARYERERQMERLAEHVLDGKSLNSFVGDSREYAIDHLITSLFDAADQVRELKKPKPKFWHRFKK